MSRRIVVGPVVVSVVLTLLGVGLTAAQGRAGRSPGARAASSAMCGTLTTAPKYKHVIVLYMENESFNTIQASSSTPYIHGLEHSCGLATNYHNITHPSLPEYMATTFGGSLAQLTPFLPDCTPSAACESTSNNIFKQLNTGTRTWKAYSESMPSNCDRANAGLYAARHNPAVYYTDLSGTCGTRDVPLGTTSSSALLKNFSSETTAPAFATVTPNLCDDMHGITGCPANLLLTGDNFLKAWVPKITSTAVYQKHDTVLFIVWDEGEGGSYKSGENCATNTTDVSCHVVFIAIAPSVKLGARATTLLNHYSLLRASEDLLGLPELDQAKTANSLLKPFNL
jgi:phosphatidylinositol-3-phosphatase